MVATLAAMITLAAAAPASAQSSKPLPALAQAPRDGLTRALQQREITPAKYALERALSLFYPSRVAARYGDVARPDPRGATLILRDLWVRRAQLSAADRQRAEALLARPTAPGNGTDPDAYSVAETTPICGDFVCVHYVTTTADAATGPYANQALQVFDDVVWPTEVTTMGYRAPKSDITSNPNNGSYVGVDATGAKFDVYLANLGDDNLYGFCTSDDPNFDNGSSYQFYDASSYCVVDNNYTEAIFGAHTPLENLQVTAAHEFFHAVQFAYDAFEDQWVMEATATWMEDELYDGVDDNVQYLVDGPLHKPTIPLDKGATNADPCCHVYGDWIFFRFLTEWFGDGGPTLNPNTTNEDATVVRDIWARLDASEDTDGLGGPDTVGPDNYSIQGVKNVLAARNRNFRKVFGKFGWTNRVSRATYDEGFDNNYPKAPLSASAMTLTKSSPSRSKSVTMNHQTNRYYEFKRGSGIGSGAKLKFVLDLPDKTTGSFATALVFTNSSTTFYELNISSGGNGTFQVPFGSSVNKVDLVLTNASTRYTCWVSGSSPYACLGTPKDDGRNYKFTARLA